MKPELFKDIAFLGGGWAASGLLEAAKLTVLGSIVFGVGLILMHYRHTKYAIRRRRHARSRRAPV